VSSIDLNSISSIIGISAIVGAAVNYFLRWVESKRQRALELVEKRLRVYIHFLFHLEILSHSVQIYVRASKGDAIFDASKKKIDMTFDVIDKQIVDSLYLLSTDIVEKWTRIEKTYPEINMETHGELLELKNNVAHECEIIKADHAKYFGRSSKYLELEISKWLARQAD
jgi:hypothetical protein